MLNHLASIIIPTHNEEKEIGECIKSLKKQNYKPIEIIIVDDGSTDKTIEIVREFPDVKVLKQEHKGPGAARNLGVKNSKGNILVFVDADMTFHEDYLKYLIKPILEDKTGKIIGTEEELQIAGNLDNIWSRCQGKVMSVPGQKDRRIFRAIKKDKFLELGGFNSKYGYADDQTFFFKYGMRSKIAGKAVCYHKNPDTLKGVFRQSKWIGASNDKLWIKLPVINIIVLILFILFSVVLIPILSIKKCIKNKNYIIFPYMLIFMTVRYFGNLAGHIKKIIFKENFR